MAPTPRFAELLLIEHAADRACLIRQQGHCPIAAQALDTIGYSTPATVAAHLGLLHTFLQTHAGDAVWDAARAEVISLRRQYSAFRGLVDSGGR